MREGSRSSLCFQKGPAQLSQEPAQTAPNSAAQIQVEVERMLYVTH
jgi:hypothetical protein